MSHSIVKDPSATRMDVLTSVKRAMDGIAFVPLLLRHPIASVPFVRVTAGMAEPSSIWALLNAMGGWYTCYTTSKILPGFKIRLGSSAFLIARIMLSSADGVCSCINCLRL